MDRKNDFSLISRYKGPIMGLAALMIYIFHQWQHQWVHPEIASPILYLLFHFPQRISFLGVDIFFLLSGMGLVYAIEKRSLFSFYIRRLERVYLPFLLSSFVMALFSGWGIIELARKVSFFDFFFVNVNSILWFVPAIIIFYLFFPAYFQLFHRSGNKFVFTVGAIAVWLVAALALKNILRGDFYSVVNRIPIFLAGIFLAWFIREKDFAITKAVWAGIVFSLVLGLFLAYMTNFKGMYLLVPISNCCVPNFLMAIPLSMIAAYAFSFINRYTLGSYVVRFFSFFGTISLELYCMHEWLDDIIRPRMSVSYEFCVDYGWCIDLVVFISAVASALLLHYACRRLLKVLRSLSH